MPDLLYTSNFSYTDGELDEIFDRKNRDRMDIIINILEVVFERSGGAKISEIMYGASLPHKSAKKHLKETENANLLRIGRKGRNYNITITERGEKLLEEYRPISEILEESEKEWRELCALKEELEKTYLTKGPVELEGMCTPD